MGLADGPTEVHKITVAREVLKGYSPSDDLLAHDPRATPEGGEARRTRRRGSSTKSGTPQGSDHAALRCITHGPVTDAVVEDIEAPTPGEGQVLVDVAAAALNFPDT